MLPIVTKNELNVLLRFLDTALGKSDMSTVEALWPDVDSAAVRRHWPLESPNMQQVKDVLEVIETVKKRNGI